MTKKIIFAVLGVLAVVVIVLGVNYFSSPSLGASGTGANHYQAENFLQGLYAGTAGQLKISNTGSLTLGSGGTAVSKYLCATATWNPGSIGTSTVNAAATSTDIALPGAVMGDTITASLTSATTSVASIDGFMSGNATATIRLLNLGTAALDLATGTAKVCYTH